MLADDAALVYARGAHAIPLLAHAAFSGDVELVQALISRGAHEGLAYAVHNALTFKHEDLVRWLLDNTKPDLTWKNWQEKTLLTVAMEQGNESLAGLLKQHGAAD
jgi:ankyrin repeat protein